jgi:methylmalonyl-CoA mutase
MMRTIRQRIGRHDDLQQAAIRNENMFEILMEATKYCSLGQLTAAMFEVGRQCRNNM